MRRMLIHLILPRGGGYTGRRKRNAGLPCCCPQRREAAPAAEVKTEFDVILNNAGSSKINVIKVIRELTGLGLMEAKTMADKTPSKVKEGVSKETATEIVEKLKAAGADVEMK